MILIRSYTRPYPLYQPDCALPDDYQAIPDPSVESIDSFFAETTEWQRGDWKLR
jgi:hypothetical protein